MFLLKFSGGGSIEKGRSFEYRRYFDPRRISVIRVSRGFLESNAVLARSREGRGERRERRKRENENRLVQFVARIAVYARYRERVASKRGRETLFYPSFRAPRGGVTCRVTSGPRSNRNGARSTDDERKPRKRNSRVASNASKIFFERIV